MTANKREQQLAYIPLSLALVEFRAAQAETSDDTASIANSIEGLALTGLGPGRNRMFLRGIADSAFNGESQSTVAVILDDARLTYSAPDPDIRLVDMERVEVLKGPQGSLYGTGALGGIYHMVSHRSDLAKGQFSVSTGGEVLSAGGSGYSLSAVANLPIVENRLAVRVVGYTAKEPGWVDTGERNDANATDVAGLRVSLGADLGGDWRLDATGFTQRLESRDTSYVYSSGSHSRPAQLPEPHDNDLRHLAMRIARENGAVRIVASSGLTWHEVVDEIDATIGATAFGLPDPQILTDDRRYRVWDSELRADGDLGDLRWLAGLSMVNARQNLNVTLESANASLVIDDDRRQTDDLAAFGDVTIPIGKQFSLNAGGRLFRSVTEESRILSNGQAKAETSKAGVTPSIVLSWKPDARQIAWLRYGSAFRQGGTDISVAGDVEQLKGDELAMLEAGWRADWPGSAKFELSAWYGWWDNLQSDLLEANGLIETANVGRAITTGIEATGLASVTQGWRVEAGGNFTMAKLVRNTLGYELADRHLPSVPEYTLRGKLIHDFALGDADVAVATSLRYVGPARLSFDPLVDRSMGNYLESSLEGSIQLDRFAVRLRAENLFASKVDTFAFGNSLRFASGRQFTPQSPMRVSATARIAF